MTQLLEQAMAEVAKRPALVQDAIAALITGAAAGFGRALAERLLQDDGTAPGQSGTASS
jgi:NADP-dependent 3-hydroxy acid dehydrogenase YdfG